MPENIFLGVLTKLRKVSISFAPPSVPPSVWNNSTPTGWIFIKIVTWYSKIFRKISSVIKTRQEFLVLLGSPMYMSDIISLNSSTSSKNETFFETNLTLWRRIFFLILANPVFKM